MYCPFMWPAVFPAAAIAAALVKHHRCYYAIWALAIVAFALAVYYTVKQLAFQKAPEP